jgi:iron complex outermembrane receptor protein
MSETVDQHTVHGVSPIGGGRVSRVVAATVSGALALAIPVTALGQSSAVTQSSGSVTGELAEIVVTAEKRSSTVQTTPLSITALTGEDLASRGLSSAQEIVQAVPGISIASAGPGQAKYEIRGLSSDGGESPTIGFYLNETPITPPASATTGKSAIDPDLYDLNRVEVLRGPQGTLYGSASMGGTVKLVTNPPDLASTYGSTETSVSGTDGGGLNYAQKGMVNIPLVDNEVALRIVGNYGHDSGWIDRIVIPNFPIETNGGLTRGNVLGLPASAIHHGVNDADVRGVRASLLIQPNSALTVTPMIFYQNISQGGLNTYDSLPGTLAHYQPFDVAEPFSDRFTVYSVTVDYAFEHAALTSATSYWSRRTSQLEDASEAVQDGLGLPAFRTADGGIGAAQSYETDTTDEFSQEIRLASTGHGKVDWLVGAFFSRFSDTFHGGSTIPGLATALGGAFGTTDLFDVSIPLVVKQQAGFANATYNVSNSWKIAAGARYFAYQSAVDSSSKGFAYGGETPILASASASASGVSPKVDISYEPLSDLLLYAIAAKGFREGGGNFPVPTTGQVGSVCLANLQAIGRESAPSLFDPDTVWSYEAGEKSRLFDHRLTLNADLFYTLWSKVQQPVALACGLGFTANGPNAEVKGGELELQAQLSSALSVTQSVALASAEFTQDFAASGIVKGQALFNAPRVTASSSIRYEHPIAGRKYVATLQNSYSSATTDLSYQINHLGPRDITNLRFGVESPKWSLFVYSTNIFNKRVDLENIDINSFTGPSYNRVATNQPLTVGLSLSVNY